LLLSAVLQPHAAAVPAMQQSINISYLPGPVAHSSKPANGQAFTHFLPITRSQVIRREQICYFNTTKMFLIVQLSRKFHFCRNSCNSEVTAQNKQTTCVSWHLTAVKQVSQTRSMTRANPHI